MFFGNFADLIIALWGGLDITVDPYSSSAKGGVRIVGFQDVDFHSSQYCINLLWQETSLMLVSNLSLDFI